MTILPGEESGQDVVLNRLELRVTATEREGPLVTPYIDGVSLADIAKVYEAAQGWTPFGGYGGLYPRNFRFGLADRYWFGEKSFPRDGQIWALGCGSCGDLGCWPLELSVILTPDMVTWADFAQPHRRNRRYDLGPFRFARNQYSDEVQRVSPFFEL